MRAATAVRRRRRLLPVVVVSVGALALSGCSLGQLGVHAGSIREASAATIKVTPTREAKAAPTVPVVVTVAAGRLTDVVVQGPAGPVPGLLSVDGRTWTSQADVLEYAASYRVSARAVDRSGLTTTLDETVRTVAPTTFLGLSVTPGQGDTVGVGMPVTVRFDRKLTARSAKAAFEKAATVTANGVAVVGGWRWPNDRNAVYRPETYWPGNAAITVSTKLKGVRLGTSVWGESNSAVRFRTGPAMVSYVDMRTDQMRVTRDGKLIRTIPITTGKAGFETRSGVKVIVSKERTRIMDAATGGTAKTDPEYYRLEVEYAMRVTYSGEFLHAAPWSVSHQGHSNVSHGCTGMSTSNAKWLYANSMPGDVVVYSGNSHTIGSGNGITVWNVPWPTWQSYSALSA